MIVPQELAGPARDAVAGGRCGLRVSWVEQLPDESLAHVLGDLTGFLDGEAFVLHLADSLAKQSLRSLTAGGAECDTEALLVTHESCGVELAQVVQLRAAAGGGPARPRPLRNDSAGVALHGAAARSRPSADLDLDPEHVLEALVERVRQRGGRVGTCGVTDWWRFRGGTEALLEGNRFALEGRRADYDRSQLADSTIQGAVIVHPEARIKSSVVRGPAIIGARARLRDAYVGPYTSIGEDVRDRGRRDRAFGGPPGGLDQPFGRPPRGKRDRPEFAGFPGLSPAAGAAADRRRGRGGVPDLRFSSAARPNFVPPSARSGKTWGRTPSARIGDLA